jgi:hypothetical protein
MPNHIIHATSANVETREPTSRTPACDAMIITIVDAEKEYSIHRIGPRRIVSQYS